MNCTDFELAVQDRLDARHTDLTPELRAHLAACPECQAVWQGQWTLLAVLKSSPPAHPPAGLVDAVIAELSRPDCTITVVPARRPPSRGSLGAILCSTAALTLLAVLLIPLTSHDEHRRASLVKTNQPAVAASPLETEREIVSQTLAGLWHDVREEYVELSQGTNRAFDDWSELPASATLLPALPGSTSETEPEEPASSWLRLDRPVSDRVGQAFDFLWDALPRPVPQSS